MTLLAQLPDVSWNVTAFVALGLIAILSVIYLILNVAIASKKLFGKQPPFHEQVADLRREFVSEFARHQADVKLLVDEHDEQDQEQFRQLGTRINDVDADVRRFRSEVVANGDQRKRDIENKVEGTRLELKGDITSVRTDLQAQTTDLLSAIGELKGWIMRSESSGLKGKR